MMGFKLVISSCNCLVSDYFYFDGWPTKAAIENAIRTKRHNAGRQPYEDDPGRRKVKEELQKYDQLLEFLDQMPDPIPPEPGSAKVMCAGVRLGDYTLEQYDLFPHDTTINVPLVTDPFGEISQGRYIDDYCGPDEKRGGTIPF